MLTKIRPVMHNVVHGYAFCMDWSIMCSYKKDFSPTDKPKKPAEDKPKSGGGESLSLFHVILPQKATCVCLAWDFFFKTFSGFFPQGGGTFNDGDLFDVGQGDYKPEGGKMSAPCLSFLLQ